MRLAWGRARSQSPEPTPDSDSAPPATQLGAVEVYLVDGGRAAGWVDVPLDQRTSDLLNSQSPLVVHAWTAADLADEEVEVGPPDGAQGRPLRRGDVRFLVPGPIATNRHLRLHRRRILMAFRMGSFEVNGQIHVRPGAEAADSLLRSSRQFVPLTDVDLIHVAEPQFRRYVPVLIVNASHVTELINLERRARASAVSDPLVSGIAAASLAHPVAAAAASAPLPGGPVLTRMAQAAAQAVQPVQQAQHEMLGALQLLLDHGLIDPREFNEKRAAIQSRP